MEEIIGGIVIGLVILIVVFLLCREIVCWYWKINISVKLMEEQNQLLRIIVSSNSDIKRALTKTSDDNISEFDSETNTDTPISEASDEWWNK
jgi:hypothetical protein